MNINQIAKLAGVSASSVSRYLNNGYLSKEKKEAIAKVIKETGYIPSSQAQTLRTKKTKIIGVIIPKIDSDSISQVVAGIGEILSSEGYQMLLANTENDHSKEFEFLNTFNQHMVDGVILLGTILTTKHKTLFKSLNFPVIVLGQLSSFVPSIYHDDYNAAVSLTNYVINKGHKKIGFMELLKKTLLLVKRENKAF